MSSFELKIDPREAQYARFAGAILKTLKEAVSRRREEDVAQCDIAHRAGIDPSSLSRILNGRIRNLTIKTVSDILWATDHEPSEIAADAIEDISSNYRPSHLRVTAANPSVLAEPIYFFGDSPRTTATRDERHHVYVMVPKQFDCRPFK